MQTLTLDRSEIEANRRLILNGLDEVQQQLACLRDRVEAQIDRLTSEGDNRAAE